MSAGVMEEAAHWGPLLEEPRFVHRTLPAGGSTFRRHSSAPLPSSPLPDSTQRRPAQGRAAYLSGHAAPSALCASCPRSCPVSCSPSLSRLESVGHPPSTGTAASSRPPQFAIRSRIMQQGHESPTEIDQLINRKMLPWPACGLGTSKLVRRVPCSAAPTLSGWRCIVQPRGSGWAPAESRPRPGNLRCWRRQCSCCMLTRLWRRPSAWLLRLLTGT